MENTKCSPARNFLFRWFPLVVYAGLIFYLSSSDDLGVPHFPYSDKVYHAILYMGFGLLFVRAFSARRSGWSRARVLEVAVLGAVVYGLTDEFHQIFVAGRSPEWMDLVADGIGGLLGGTLYLGISYAQRNQARRAVEGEAPSGFAGGGGDASP